MSLSISTTVLASASPSPEELHRLGIAAYTSGDSEQARRLFERLLALQPENPVAWSNHGVACRSLGDCVAAQQSLEWALQLCPDYADAWNNLGTVFEQTDLHRAIDCFRRARQLQPNGIDACNNLALCYKKQQLFGDAASCYRQSLLIDPCQPTAWYRLAEVLEQCSDVGGACHAYQKSLQLQPDDAVRLKMETVLPVILQSVDALHRLRENLTSRLQLLQQQHLRIERPWEKGRVLFYLAYHGCNDRKFHEQMAAIYRTACPELTWHAPHVARSRASRQRIRIGFISRFFYNHTIAKLNIGLIEQLDRARFHVSVLLIDAGLRDSMTQRFEDAADNFLVLPKDFCTMREQIAAQELDILFYTDIGMEPFSYFLAFARLARVQCVTWGHPATTGIDTVDYFISHAACETKESRSAYSEKLFCLSDAAACACYARPTLPFSEKQPGQYGIESGRTIYFCPQPPFKQHPDFDLLLKGILERDPDGLVVLLRGVAAEAEQLLCKRFSLVMPEYLGRVRFIDPLPFADYIRMLELADVVLDSPHFSGGSSSVEALAVGAVVVTLPSAFLKGRLTAAWYRQIGVTDCIAGSPEEYIAIAVRLGTDRVFRSSIRNRIMAAAQRLFDDSQYVRELEMFFENVLP